MFPLWASRDHIAPNPKTELLRVLSESLSMKVSAPDLMAYLGAIAAHPGYIERFRPDLIQPGLRFPLTADTSLFLESVEVGKEIIWLHCFGERFADPEAGRPSSPPRMPKGRRPFIPKEGAILSGSGLLSQQHRV